MPTLHMARNALLDTSLASVTPCSPDLKRPELDAKYLQARYLESPNLNFDGLEAIDTQRYITEGSRKKLRQTPIERCGTSHQQGKYKRPSKNAFNIA